MRYTTKTFIEKAREVHGDKYDYSKTVYVGSKTNICIICPLHGEFYKRPYRHIKEEQICPKCQVMEGSKNRNMQKLIGVIQPEDYKLIPITKGHLVLVDNEDFEELSKYSWYCHNGRYAMNDYLGFMHRYIMDAPEGMYVDHINHDTTDNRRCNLRLCTNQENSFNSKPNPGTSVYKGVSRTASGKWRARIRYNGVATLLGHFDCELEAAKAYDKKAKELYKEFAYLNFKD